jgi:intracellular multiplication protein IcmX
MKYKSLYASLCFSAFITIYPIQSSWAFGEGDVQTLTERVTNLGKYFGYDIKTEPSADNDKGPEQQLFDYTKSNALANMLIKSFLTTQPINTALGQVAKTLVPEGLGFDAINRYANATFITQGQGGNTAQNGIMTTQPLIDQKPYQADPVSQVLLNLVGTPEFNYCRTSTGGLRDDCLFDTKVLSNIIGNVPDPISFGNVQKNPPSFLSSVNVNALLGPLVYQQGNGENNNNGNDAGLSSNNQQDTALNFIRYITATVSPINLPSLEDYNKIYQGLYATDPAKKLASKEILSKYLIKLRVYSAQASVGISNLYYIFAKRVIPTSGANSSDEKQSQALIEYNMATHRLFNSSDDKSKNKPDWMTKLNNATPAQVQKEIALLLAEINYQMYLNRQQDERMLLTNSMLLLLQTRQGAPESNITQNNDE